MRFCGSNLIIFFENQLTTSAHLVQFKRVLMLCLGNWASWVSLGNATAHDVTIYFDV